MLLLQTWYGLNDYQVEDRVNDSFACSEFIGLPLDFPSPDHSLVSKFRTELTKTKAFEKLFKEINKQRMKKGIIVKEGAIVDATLTRSPRSPKGKATYEITNDLEDPKDPEQEKEQLKLVKVKQPGVDDEARWVCKGGDFTFGYKAHAVSDPNGLFIGIHTTEANVNEISNLEVVLANVPIEKGARLFGDKGYRSQKNEKLLKKMGLKNGIMHKKSRGKTLSRAKQEMNDFITQHRYPIERSFGGIKRWFKSGVARYAGLEKTHTQHLMEAIAYNLKRSPGIVMSMS